MPTKRHSRGRAAKVLQSAFPDLDADEVQRLLEEAQRVKRKETRYLHVHARTGKTLQVEPLQRS